MKTSRIERVISGLQNERSYLAKHAALLREAGTATDVLEKRLDIVDELLAMLSEPETQEPPAAQKRARKARKAGLPAAE